MSTTAHAAHPTSLLAWAAVTLFLVICQPACTVWLCVYPGAAFLDDQLVSVGADGNICIWALANAALHHGSSVAPAVQAALSGIPRQHRQLRQPHAAISAAAVCTGDASCNDDDAVQAWRSWLQSRRAAGSVAAVAGGLEVPEESPLQADEGAAITRQDMGGGSVLLGCMC